MKKLSELMILYLKNDDGSYNMYGKLLKILAIIIIARISTMVVNVLIDRAILKSDSKRMGISEQRANTLAEISKNIMKYLIYFIGIMAVLDMFINTNSILATAGIGGLAIGFGAQSLVKDVITGFFILLEDQYALGDHVQIEGYEGIIEELGVRVTKIRSFDGELHIIPNGNIQIVTNKNRGDMRALVEISVAYEEDIENVMRVLEGVCKKVAKNENITSGPVILGVNNLANSGVIIGVSAFSKPLGQWDVQRLLRREIKEALQRENIEIPYNKIEIVGGEDNA